jgi:hypothetical protein
MRLFTRPPVAEMRSLKRELPEEHRDRVARAIEIVDQIVNTPTTHRLGHVGCTLTPWDGSAVIDWKKSGRGVVRRATMKEAYDIRAEFHVMHHHIDGRSLPVPQVAALFRKLAKDLNASAAKLERADQKAVCQ